MAELGAVLRETWRRFWPNSVLWVSLLLLGLGFLVGSVLFGAMGLLGVRLLIPGLWAYAAMGLAGLSGVLAAAARFGRATTKDFDQGVRRFFWRMVGLLGLVAAYQFVVSLVTGAVTGVRFVEMLTSVTFDPSAVARTLVAGQIIGIFAGGGMVLLFGFAPAAIGLEGCATIDGIARGLQFVGRRLGLVAGLLIVGFVLYQLPSLLLSWPMTGLFRSAAPTIAAGGPVPPHFMAALNRSMVAALFFLLYVCVAGPFITLSFVVGYGRDRGLVGPIAPAPPTSLPGLPGLGGPDKPGPPAGPSTKTGDR